MSCKVESMESEGDASPQKGGTFTQKFRCVLKCVLDREGDCDEVGDRRWTEKLMDRMLAWISN